MSPSGQPTDAAQVRCACETMATTGMIIVAGEIRTQAYVDVPALAREVLSEIGYDRAKYGHDRAKYGFDCDTCGVLNAIHDQSPDIAPGVPVVHKVCNICSCAMSLARPCKCHRASAPPVR